VIGLTSVEQKMREHHVDDKNIRNTIAHGFPKCAYWIKTWATQ
jgi:hypothetical protein